jgi:HEAT repeat protein
MTLIKKIESHGTDLDERQHERDLDGLIAQLSHPDPAPRRWAARDLMNFRHASAALVNRLRCEDDMSVREIILTSLARLGDLTAVNGLVACLRSEDAQTRNEAIEAMKALPSEMAPIMGNLLADEDPDVRILALSILEAFPHPKVEGWLIEVIKHDPAVNVCGAAVDLLTEVGSTAAHDALRRLKHRFPDEPYIQFAADLALQRIVSG